MTKRGDYVTVKGWRGVSFEVLGRALVWEPVMVLAEDVETGEEYETPDPYGEGEWIEDESSNRLRVQMVGDDRIHEVDEDQCAVLDADEFCAVCGQIGCYHDGRSREV